jgi:hypothetical protein
MVPYSGGVANEGWVDGCLNEGLAALVAAEEARDATDPEEARISAQIAGDEAEHAALAFEVVRWVLDQDRSLTPNRAERAESAPFASSPLGPHRLRELANHHSRSALRCLV